jgi:hypothetical protein
MDMKILWFSFALCLLAVNCTKEDDFERNYDISIGNIIAIESLSNISLGQSDTIVITFSGGTNGCAHSDHLETLIDGKTIIFKAFYNYPLGPRICTDNIPIHNLKYVFKPASAGTYIYKSFDTEVESSTDVN